MHSAHCVCLGPLGLGERRPPVTTSGFVRQGPLLAAPQAADGGRPAAPPHPCKRRCGGRWWRSPWTSQRQWHRWSYVPVARPVGSTSPRGLSLAPPASAPRTSYGSSSRGSIARPPRWCGRRWPRTRSSPQQLFAGVVDTGGGGRPAMWECASRGPHRRTLQWWRTLPTC